jgi:hypothetical protein
LIPLAYAFAYIHRWTSFAIQVLCILFVSTTSNPKGDMVSCQTGRRRIIFTCSAIRLVACGRTKMTVKMRPLSSRFLLPALFPGNDPSDCMGHGIIRDSADLHNWQLMYYYVCENATPIWLVGVVGVGVLFRSAELLCRRRLCGNNQSARELFCVLCPGKRHLRVFRLHDSRTSWSPLPSENTWSMARSNYIFPLYRT